jgi:hypothetical protein
MELSEVNDAFGQSTSDEPLAPAAPASIEDVYREPSNYPPSWRGTSDAPAASGEEPHGRAAQRMYGTVEVAKEHLPAEAAPRVSSLDAPTFRTRLEALLESDPETLGQVRELLDEPDAIVRAQNLDLLRATFGVE